MSDKGIYQPGTLRKVNSHNHNVAFALQSKYLMQKQVVLRKLGEVTATLKTGATKLSCLAQEHFPTGLMDRDVSVFKAVVAQNGRLVNVGDSVRISSACREPVSGSIMLSIPMA